MFPVIVVATILLGIITLIWLITINERNEARRELRALERELKRQFDPNHIPWLNDKDRDNQPHRWNMVQQNVINKTVPWGKQFSNLCRQVQVFNRAVDPNKQETDNETDS